MSIYAIGVLVSVIVYIAIGNYAGTRVKNVSDYYVSGRSAPTLLILGTLLASMISTNSFMGDSGWSYSGYFVWAVGVNMICAIGYVIGPMYFGRYIRRMEALTIPQYFGDRFNSPRIRRVAGITTILVVSAYLLAVIQGTTMLMQELTGFSLLASLLISWFCFTSFTFYSGSKGVILTDTIMFMVFVSASIVAGPYIFNAAGGVTNVIPSILSNPEVPSDMMKYHGHLGGGTIGQAFTYIITYGIIWIVAIAVNPWQGGRNLMAKSEHVTIRAGVAAAIGMIIFLNFLYFLSAAIMNLNSGIDPNEKVIIWGALNHTPTIVGVVILTGIMAAGLSSASTFLSLMGFSAADDVVKFNFKSDKQKLLFSRSVMIVISLIVLALAYFNPPAIRLITWMAASVLASSWGPVAFASVWSKKLTERGAFYGMILGFVGHLAAEILVKNFGVDYLTGPLHPFFIGVYLSIAAMYLGSRGQLPTWDERDFLKRMHITPKGQVTVEGIKRDKKYAIAFMALGVISAIVFITYWAIPVMNYVG